MEREDLTQIKNGEEHKKKFYRALCMMENPATVDLIQKLNIPNSFFVQQKTPLRYEYRIVTITFVLNSTSITTYACQLWLGHRTHVQL